LPQKVQTLTYEKIRFGLELLLRLAKGIFEQPAGHNFFNGLLAAPFPPSPARIRLFRLPLPGIAFQTQMDIRFRLID
jgi:hypothetical protein